MTWPPCRGGWRESRSAASGRSVGITPVDHHHRQLDQLARDDQRQQPQRHAALEVQRRQDRADEQLVADRIQPRAASRRSTAAAPGDGSVQHVGRRRQRHHPQRQHGVRRRRTERHPEQPAQRQPRQAEQVRQAGDLVGGGRGHGRRAAYQRPPPQGESFVAPPMGAAAIQVHNDVVFDFGGGELVVLCLLALIFFGATKLP